MLKRSIKIRSHIRWTCTAKSGTVEYVLVYLLIAISFVGFYTEEGVKNKGLLPSLFSMATIVALVGAICVLLFVFNELWPDKAKTKIVYLKVPSSTIFSDIASEKMMYPALIL